jgi:hypothetical protein
MAPGDGIRLVVAGGSDALLPHQFAATAAKHYISES